MLNPNFAVLNLSHVNLLLSLLLKLDLGVLACLFVCPVCNKVLGE